MPITPQARTRLHLAPCLLVALMGCADLDPVTERAFALPPPLPTLVKRVARPDIPQRPPADLVVLVSIDGLRPDAITPSMSSMHRLSQEGLSARTARTIENSTTLPSHGSMVSGAEPSEHGLNFNSYKRNQQNIARPTIFSIAHAAGLPTYMYVGKPKLKHLLGHAADAELNIAGMNCRRAVKQALPQLRHMTRGLLFAHFADPDSAGHRHGWMSDDYIEAVRSADSCLEDVMEALLESGHLDRTLLLVTADHGGHHRNHGSQLEVDRRIPWYAWGANTRPGRVQRPVHTTDTAATVLAALGLGLPSDIRGRPVADAFGASADAMPVVGAPLAAP